MKLFIVKVEKCPSWHSFLPCCQGGGRTQDFPLHLSVSFYIQTLSKLLVLPQQRPWTFKAIYRDRPLSQSIWLSKEALAAHTYLFAGLGLIFSVTEFTFHKRAECHCQLVSAKQDKKKISHFHRTIRMGRCFLLKVSHHWQWKVSSTPTFESFPSSGSKAQLMAEEAIFLQKREFCIRSNLNINIHDLKEKKTHNFIFHIMLSTDKGKRIIQHFRAWADRNKIEICLKICHLREELLTLLWHWEEGE